jgi:hypothetical protein
MSTSSNKQIDILHQDSYLYNVYDEFMQNVQHYSLNSSIRSLSIRYYRNSISTGYDEDTSSFNSDKYDKIYDVFDFTPVLEMQPLSYGTMDDEAGQGLIRKTESIMTILSVSEPLLGDILYFYPGTHTEVNDTEVFVVREVNFIRSQKKLNMYQIRFETAQLTHTSLQLVKINKHSYFIREFDKFFDSELYSSFTFLLKNRNDIVHTINKSYNPIKCRYEINRSLFEHTLSYKSFDDYNDHLIECEKILNKHILYIQDKYNMGFKYIRCTSPELEKLEKLDDDYIYYEQAKTSDFGNFGNFSDKHKDHTKIELMIELKKISDIYIQFETDGGIDNNTDKAKGL